MTTIDEQVGHGDDDAFESGSDASFSSTAVNINRSDNTLAFLSGLGGDRFQTVAIGNADTIDTAKLTVDIITTSDDDASVTIEGEDVDDAVSFVTNADVFNRVRTTAAVTWQSDGLGAGTEDSPEIKAVIQEIVNRGGWATGQDMCIITVPLATASKVFKTTSYEGDTALATKLHVEFTAGGAPNTRRYSLPVLGVG